jgi:hypothetical protein
MVDVKQAASTAADYLVNLYPQQVPSEVRLEEVELSEDESHWLITLSYIVPRSVFADVPGILSHRREYKVFKIDAATGQVRSMKIRKLD